MNRQKSLLCKQAQTGLHNDSRQTVSKQNRDSQNFWMLTCKQLACNKETDTASCNVCTEAMKKGQNIIIVTLGRDDLLIVHSIN